MYPNPGTVSCASTHSIPLPHEGWLRADYKVGLMMLLKTVWKTSSPHFTRWIILGNMKSWLHCTNFSKVRHLYESIAHACQPLLIKSKFTQLCPKEETANNLCLCEQAAVCTKSKTKPGEQTGAFISRSHKLHCLYPTLSRYLLASQKHREGGPWCCRVLSPVSPASSTSSWF